MRKLVSNSILFTGLLLFLSGCGARSQSAGHVRPVIAALESYHRDHHAYPTNLAQLSPAYLKGDLKKFLEGHSGVGILWSLQYQQLSSHDYQLWFRGAHHDAQYKNGKFVSGSTSYFR
jgi:hypothetical protein